MNGNLIKSAREMVKIANKLDEVGYFGLAEEVDAAARRILISQTGVNDLVAPNLLDPEQVDDLQEKRDDEDDQLQEMLEEDQEAVEDQRGNLDEHEEDVVTPLNELVQR